MKTSFFLFITGDSGVQYLISAIPTLPSLAILDLTSNGITHKGLSLIANALTARDSTRTDTQQVSSLKGNCPSCPTLPNKLMAPAFCNQIKSKNKLNSLKQRANYTNESRLHTYHTDLRQISCRFVHFLWLQLTLSRVCFCWIVFPSCTNSSLNICSKLYFRNSPTCYSFVL